MGDFPCSERAKGGGRNAEVSNCAQSTHAPISQLLQQ